MATNRMRVALGVLTLAALLGGAPAHSQTSFHVTLDTTPLIGDTAAAPFYVNFELVDGSGTGDANNTATLTDFTFGGGGTAGTPTLTGGATGSLDSQVSLTDSAFLNEFVQPITPGDTLGFDVSLTGNADAGPTPDEFSFAIKDCMLTEIPTLGPGDALLVGDLIPGATVIQTFPGDTSRAPSCGGGPIPLAAPAVVIPEPSTLWLLLPGAALAVARRRRGRRA